MTKLIDMLDSAKKTAQELLEQEKEDFGERIAMQCAVKNLEAAICAVKFYQATKSRVKTALKQKVK